MKFYTVHTKPYIKLRIIATLIDYTIFFFLYYIMLYTMGENQGGGKYVLYGWPVLLIPVCWTIYFVITEASNQSTPGHAFCHLKVYKTNGQKPGFKDAFKRRVCDPLDIFVYGLPALICISKTPKNQRLGDLFADTVVVKASDIEIKEVEF